jgi:hypothetical protein
MLAHYFWELLMLITPYLAGWSMYRMIESKGHNRHNLSSSVASF